MRTNTAGNLDIRFTILNGGLYVTVFTFSNFYNSFLYDFGFREGFIGIVMTVQAISVILCNIMLGTLMDRRARYRQTMIAIAIAFTVQVPLFFWLGHQKAAALLFSVLGLAPATAMIALMDSWIMKLRRQGYAVQYTRARAVGSLSHAAFSAILGRVLVSFGNRFAIITVIAGSMLCLFLVMGLPNPAAADESKERGKWWEALQMMFSHKSYIVLLACMFFTNITNLSSFSYFPLRIRAMGGSNAVVGLSTLVISVSEFLVVFNFGKLRRRFQTTTLLGIGMLGFAVRSLAMALAPSLPIAVLVGVTQALSFAPYTSGIVLYIGEKYEEHYIARYITISNCVNNLVGISLNPVFGSTAERFGISSMMLAFCGTALFAGIFFLIYNRKRSEDRPQPTKPVR